VAKTTFGRGARAAFYKLVNEAIDDLTEYGFDSQQRLDSWMARLELAARAALLPADVMMRAMRDALTQQFRRLVNGSALQRKHRGIDQYTLASIKPKLHAELERRILASANLIKLNREASIQRTLRRFAGWATSVPAGGTEATERPAIKRSIRKAVTALPFEERRVIIDQGHKLVAAVNEIVAVDGGAIAGIWHSHWREAGYDYREDHKERDGKFYVLRDNWALRKGFMKLAGHEYTDQITEPGFEPFCRCRYQFVYSLRQLPSEMITTKGREALLAARAKIGLHEHAYGA
jgi:hypothetical protein